MKKILSICLVLLLLLTPIISVEAKSKSSTSSSSMPSTTVNKKNNSSSNYYSKPHYNSRNYYGGFSFPWLWFILMDSDEEQVQAYCVPLADTNGDGAVEESEASEEYQDCVKQYSSFSFMGFFITLLIILFIIRIVALFLNNRRR